MALQSLGQMACSMILTLAGFAVASMRDENIHMHQTANGYCENAGAGLSKGSQRRVYRG